MSKFAFDASWEEGKHKRADNGQFGSGGGSSGGAKKPAVGKPTSSANAKTTDYSKFTEEELGEMGSAALKEYLATLPTEMGKGFVRGKEPQAWKDAAAKMNAINDAYVTKFNEKKPVKSSSVQAVELHQTGRGLAHLGKKSEVHAEAKKQGHSDEEAKHVVDGWTLARQNKKLPID